MLQLSKKIEYGLIALRHIAMGPSSKIFTTKEISEKYQIPYDLLAKILQRFVKCGFLNSHQGVYGGYSLAKDPNEVTISTIIQAIEGKSNVILVQCESDVLNSCNISETCTIRNPLLKLQNSIKDILDRMTIMEMV